MITVAFALCICLFLLTGVTFAFIIIRNFDTENTHDNRRLAELEQNLPPEGYQRKRALEQLFEEEEKRNE